MITRREVMLGASAAVVASSCSSKKEIMVNDISQLEETCVAAVLPVHELSDLRMLFEQHAGWVSVAGGKYSMGGQTSADQSLQINTDLYQRLIFLDVERKVVRVQAGMRWRQLQDHLDAHDLSVKVMQSFSNFSIGGSVSVNCHGRYVNAGSIAHTIRSLQVVLSDGQVLELSRTQNPELFFGFIGGYGLLGFISEVELDVVNNCSMVRTVEQVALEDYPVWFAQHIQGDPTAIMHNADLVPPNFNQPLAITWHETSLPLTDHRRLLTHGQKYSQEQNAIWAFSELPGGASVRQKLFVEKKLQEHRVIKRNLEASLDVASLEPRTRWMSTYLLQEYFIPVRHFHRFAKSMADILKQYDVNALNVSIRHAPPDDVALMKWAKEEVFCFVLYYKQRRYPWSDGQTVPWTRSLIDAALSCEGRYYLPYRPHATQEQFVKAYPEVQEFIRLKQQVDPNMRLTNHLWQRYFNQLI